MRKQKNNLKQYSTSITSNCKS